MFKVEKFGKGESKVMIFCWKMKGLVLNVCVVEELIFFVVMKIFGLLVVIIIKF